jgi:hypothetical protein
LVQHNSQASALEPANALLRRGHSFRDRPRCAVLSRAEGEDAIGTAPPNSQFLFVEVPLPWPHKVWAAKRVPPGVIEALKQRKACGLDLKPRAIAPDPEYSRPGFTRVMYFHRPEGAFATFSRDEFLVPGDQAAPLLNVLLSGSTANLRPFERFRVDSSGVRDLLVCTHGSEDACCGTFGFPLYRRLRQHYAAPSGGALRAWRVSHIGGHRFAPTMLDFPHGHCWSHLDAEATLDSLVLRKGPLEPVLCKYRGWSGLNFYEQLVEREAFLREGWAWIGYFKSSHTFGDDRQWDLAEIDPVFDDEVPRRANVHLAFAAPDGSVAGAYEATVEFTGRRKGVGDCGADFWERNTYRVCRLEKSQVSI